MEILLVLASDTLKHRATCTNNTKVFHRFQSDANSARGYIVFLSIKFLLIVLFYQLWYPSRNGVLMLTTGMHRAFNSSISIEYHCSSRRSTTFLKRGVLFGIVAVIISLILRWNSFLHEFIGFNIEYDDVILLLRRRPVCPRLFPC